MPKQEVCDNVPLSLTKMKLSGKLLAIKRRLDRRLKRRLAAENEANVLRKENETLKTSLAAKSPTEKKERPIAKAKKRPWSEISDWQSSVGNPKKKATPTHFRCTFCPDTSQSLMSFETIEKYRSHVYEAHPPKLVPPHCQ